MKTDVRLFKWVSFISIILWSLNVYPYEVCKTIDPIKELKWNSNKTMYYINPSGSPSGSIDAIVAGMQTWTDVASADFTFIYDGETGNVSHGINDGINIVTFGSLPVGTLAENIFWYQDKPNYQFARIVDSDVRYNTYYTWSTDDSPDTYDVQNIGTHELGHSLCLADLTNGSDSEKTMYYSARVGETKKSSLHQDDIDGITYLYTCQFYPVRIVRSTIMYYYSSLQAAYDAANPDESIESHAIVFNENFPPLYPLNLNLSKHVSFAGGYNCDYNKLIDNPSVINGTVNLSSGTVTMENFTVE